MTQADSIHYKNVSGEVSNAQSAGPDNHTAALHSDAYETWRSGGWNQDQNSSYEQELPTGYNWQNEMPTAGGVTYGQSGAGGYESGGYGNGQYVPGGYESGGYGNGQYVPGGYESGGYGNDQNVPGGYESGGYGNGQYTQGGYDSGGYGPGQYGSGQNGSGEYQPGPYTPGVSGTGDNGLGQAVAAVDPNFAQLLNTYQGQLSAQGFMALEQLDLAKNQYDSSMSDEDLLKAAVSSNLLASSDTSIIQNSILPTLQLQDVDSNVSATGVDQGSHGDCVFDASMAAVANTPNGQSKIENMIAPNSDGSYTVTFPGDSSHPVTVTQADLSQEQVKDSGQWADILEAAMLKNYPELAKGNTPKNAPGGTDGSPPSPAQYALYLLTGNTASKTDASDSSIGDKLEKAVSDQQPVTAFCANNDNGALVDGHEWTVEDYDAKSQTVTLRNPWGSNPSSDASKSGVTNLGNGVVQMSLQNFQKYYKEVTFANVN